MAAQDTTDPTLDDELHAIVDTYISPATTVAGAAFAREAMAKAAAYMLWRSFGGDAGAAFGSIGYFVQRVGYHVNELYAAAERRGKS